MGVALKIRDDLSPGALCRLARKARGRAESARLAGMERQALRDAVVRYNAEGLAGVSALFSSRR